MKLKVLVVAAFAMVLIGSVLTLPRAEAAPPQPYNLYGVARNAAAVNLALGTRITTFIDGVDYSNGTSVYTNTPSPYNYDVDTAGNWVTAPGQENTLEVKEGGDLGDAIMYVA